MLLSEIKSIKPTRPRKAKKPVKPKKVIKPVIIIDTKTGETDGN